MIGEFVMSCKKKKKKTVETDNGGPIAIVTLTYFLIAMKSIPISMKLWEDSI